MKAMNWALEKPIVGLSHFWAKNDTVRPDGNKKYVIDKNRSFYYFDVTPVPAPRMTKSDKWKTNPNHKDPLKRQRACVAEYFSYRDRLRFKAKAIGYEIAEQLEIVFFVPMPQSWSEKKKARMTGHACRVKPDNDNYLKAFRDALSQNDGNIWHDDAMKIYSYAGGILVYK